MCVQPLTVRLKNRFYDCQPVCQQVPCGKCVECQKRKQNDLAIRFYYEFPLHFKTSFITLTYRTSAVPYYVNTETGEYRLILCKKHVQNAIKRFRIQFERKYGKKADFKYYVCGEYGHKRTHRPHYHILFFGLSYELVLPFLKDWRKRYGFYYFEEVKTSLGDYERVSRYVSKYTIKGQFEPYDDLPWFAKPFRTNSHFIGIKFLDYKSEFLGKNLLMYTARFADRKKCIYDDWYLEFLRNNLFIHLSDAKFKYPIPAYYRNKIITPKTPLAYQFSQYLRDFYGRLRDEKLRELQAEMSLGEACCALLVQDAFDKAHRVDKIVKNMKMFYRKSVF